jgi:hypothetical protein
MRASNVISPSLFALLLLTTSGIATAVSTTVAWSLREAPPPCVVGPVTPAVDPLQAVLVSAMQAELGLGDEEALDPTKVARAARLYRFYVDESARLQAAGSVPWARTRATDFEQLQADMNEMLRLERDRGRASAWQPDRTA